MEKPQYQVMYNVEDTHFWYVGMRAITASILSKLNVAPSAKILDAGCGTGANIPFLSQYGKVVGIDISSEAIRLCRQRGLSSIKLGSIDNIPYPNNSFNLVTNFDVIGSKEVNEAKAIAEFYRVLKPGGYLLLRASAYNSLYSKHDKVVHTKRRYSKTNLIRAITSQPFEIVRTTFANTILFPLVAIRRIWQKRFVKNNLAKLHESDVIPLPNWINYFAVFPLQIEAQLVRSFDLPFGLSLIIVARKPLQLP